MIWKTHPHPADFEAQRSLRGGSILNLAALDVALVRGRVPCAETHLQTVSLLVTKPCQIADMEGWCPSAPKEF